jgi:tetratricopeptide (TPR) repeat protein
VEHSGIQKCIDKATAQHQLEYEAGTNNFGCSDVECWCSDDDFLEYQVKAGSGGPCENKLKNGNKIFETKKRLLDDSECDFFIQTAQNTIRDEREVSVPVDVKDGQRPDWQRTNSELGEARLSALPPNALEKIRTLLKETLFPMLYDRFGIENLTVYDGLILGSIAPSRSQPVHRDASLLTLNIALSSPDEYDGGGTYVEGLENHSGEPLRISKGKALCHSSGIMHAGTSISRGQRWVMVLFVISKTEVEVARRCHAEGLSHIDAKRFEEAKCSFHAGLLEAQNDHLLHMGLGQVASIQGNEQEALDCLFKTAKYYPESHKASMTIAKILESKKKPRAALRRYELVLSNINNRDLPERAWMPLKALAWEARVSAATCALLCAEFEARNYKLFRGNRSWSKMHLPKAIDRLKQALIPAPNNEYIESMLARAEELLRES